MALADQQAAGAEEEEDVLDLDVASLMELRHWLQGDDPPWGSPQPAKRIERMLERQPHRREEIKAMMQICVAEVCTDSVRGGETALFRTLRHGLLIVADLLVELGATT